MTYENCKKYMEEAEGEEKEFWAERIKRKYPNVVEEVEEVKEEKPKPKKPKKKEKVEDGDN